ncbi:T9SS type A sorting domain-containing protein [Chryseobacterium sp. B21-037]|uniref:T9SS type A sorting domain-containing protein n=1 Tax=unclassified Chryseobacterium TaxID=2593645 RepID=UPI002359EEBA|nr:MULTISPECIES: T9SS type A sorting domain-containing protein [unclassified Chryseobacterium]MDC8105148.1 T9SS type A sorting domain-containing protein [Chryseobacterium sp. B21-037]MDQ1805406.1 T9SS type A sorting domain-containing protein [Chryseobacterium sp. CKR4-1]
MYKMLFIFCVSFSCMAYSQNLNFTDAKFKALLLTSGPGSQIAKDINGNNIKIDANGDGQIQLTEAQQVKTLNIKFNVLPTYNSLPNQITDALLFPNVEELYIHDTKSAVISFVNNNKIKKVLYTGSGGFVNNVGVSHRVPIDFSFDNCGAVENVNDFVADINLSPYDPSTILRYKNCLLIKDDIVLNNKNIKELHIKNCHVKTLTFTSCKRLNKISVPNLNSLTKISVSGSTGTILPSGNQNIHLVAKSCTNLEEVIADTDHYETTGAYFTSVDLNGCTSLKRIKGLNASSINFSNAGLINLEELDASFYNRYGYYTTSGVYFGNVTSLDVSGLPKLKILKAFNQPITNATFNSAAALEDMDITNSCGYMAVLNVDNLTHLQTLKADIPGDLNFLNPHTDLQQISAQNCISLVNLSIKGNKDLKSLDLQNCSAIQTLNLGPNLPGNSPFDTFTELNSLNINQCNSLRELGIANTKISTIDLSQCPQLESADLEYNSLVNNINFSQNGQLKYLTLRSCPLITNLNLSDCNVLEAIAFFNMSGLTQVNIKNNALEGCEFSGYNSNLTICVDPAQLTDLQTMYPDINFSTNCPATTNSKNTKLDHIITKIDVFPNPVKNILQIRSPEPVNTIDIFDSMGRSVSHQSCGKGDCTINTSGYPAGIYLIKIKTKSTEISKKIIKN